MYLYLFYTMLTKVSNFKIKIVIIMYMRIYQNILVWFAILLFELNNFMTKKIWICLANYFFAVQIFFNSKIYKIISQEKCNKKVTKM